MMHCFENIRETLMREGPVTRAAIVAFFVAAVIYGGGKGDGGDGGGGGDPPPRGVPAAGDPQEPRSFTEAEQALGFACVTNPAAVASRCINGADHVWASFDTTSNAVAKASWLATGVFDDYFAVTPPTNAPVRIGTNDVRRLMVFSHGRAKAILGNGDAAYLEPFHAPMSFVAEGKWAECGVTSRCWTASSPASTIVAWECALLDRDTAQPLSFQIEFLRNGDFIYRYGDTDAIDALTNATFSIGGPGASVPPGETSSVTGAISRASSIYFADVSAYGDGTGDTDEDGLTDYDELMLLGTDPLVADTDGDGLGDGAEIVSGTDPFDFDTDGDGLADGFDQAPLVSCGTAFGQSSAWIAATFTNSSEIISMGYDDYLLSQTDGDDGERRYVFYVELDGVGQYGGDVQGPPEVLVSVGGQRVVANENGTYGFLLNVGPEYQFGVTPPCAASFSASRSDALVSLNGGGVSGTVTLRPAGVAVAPGDQYCYGSGEIHEFTGVCVGADPAVVDSWEWSFVDDDENDADYVQIYSPNSRTTGAAWFFDGDGDDVDWASRRITLTCRIGDWSATSEALIHRGRRTAPLTLVGISLPPAFFAGEDADVVVTYWADEPAEGEITVSDASLSQSLIGGLPWTFALDGESHEFCATGVIHAATMSSVSGDIVLEAELVRDGGGNAYCTANSTAVALDRVAVSGAPASGLVALAGSEVPMSAVCVPAGANLDDAECDWHVGRRTRNGGHEGWVKIGDDIPGDTFSPTMGTGGIYRVKVEMTLCGATRETYYKIASRNDFDPPESNYHVGGYDHIGVASEQWQIALRNTALSHLGSTAFAKEYFLPSYYGFSEVASGYWKCNAFVAYCICQSNLAVPAKTSLMHDRTYPPSANVWAVKTVKWWEKANANSIEPGFVVGHPASVGHGHCGIVDYDGFAIGAGEFSVNRKFTKFLDGSCGFNKFGGE